MATARPLGRCDLTTLGTCLGRRVGTLLGGAAKQRLLALHQELLHEVELLLDTGRVLAAQLGNLRPQAANLRGQSVDLAVLELGDLAQDLGVALARQVDHGHTLQSQ